MNEFQDDDAVTSESAEPAFQLLSVKQAAARLGCSAANLYGLINRGELPFVRIGRSKGYRIDSRDLDAFVQERKRARPGAAARALPARPKLKHIRF